MTTQPQLTLADAKKYIQRWEEGAYRRDEEVLDRLFTEEPSKYGRNHLEFVRVATLDSLYSTGITKGHHSAIADALSEMTIAEALAEGDIGVVEKVMRAIGKKIGGPCSEKARRGMYPSFASKYCGFHNYHAYPLFDRHVRYMLEMYLRQEPKQLGFYGGGGLHSYKGYRDAIKCLMRRSGLTKLNFREVDHYLWLKGRKIPRKLQDQHIRAKRAERQGSSGSA